MSDKASSVPGCGGPAPPTRILSATFGEHFAASRARTDAIIWSFLLLAAGFLGVAHFFQALQTTHHHTHPPTTACTWTPKPTPSTCPPLPPAPHPPPRTPTYHLVISSLLKPTCPGTSASSYATLLVFLVAVVACLSASWLAPAWSRRGGRTLLVGTARVLPRLIGLLQALPLLPSPPTTPLGATITTTSAACLPLPSSGAGGAFGLLFTAVLFPVPLKPQLLVATLEATLLVAHTALARATPTPAPHLLLLALQAATLGVLLPSLLLATYHRSLLVQHTQLASAAPPPPHLPPPQHPRGTPQPPGQPAPPTSIPLPNDVTPHGRPPTRRPYTPLTHRQAPIALPSNLQPPRPGLYTSRLRTCTVSIKVRHPDAFAQRDQLTMAVEACLSNLCTATPQPPPSTPLPSTPRLPHPPPPSAPALMSSVTIQGCLQIVTNIYLPVTAPLPPLDPATLTPLILAALPPPFNQAPTTVWTTPTHYPAPPPTPTPISSPSSPPLSATPMYLHPPCLKAGHHSPQELLLAPVRNPSNAPQSSGGLPCSSHGTTSVEAVVRCWQGWQPVVLRQLLEPPHRNASATSSSSIGSGDGGAHECYRLQLPANLDAAPVEVHLLAACPGHEGTPLGAATTMALPPAAAQQLLATLQAPQAPPSSTQPHPSPAAQAAALLNDWAGVWLSRAQPGSGGLPEATEAAVLHSVDHWLAAHCGTAFRHHLPSTLPPQPLPHPPQHRQLASPAQPGRASYQPQQQPQQPPQQPPQLLTPPTTPPQQEERRRVLRHQPPGRPHTPHSRSASARAQNHPATPRSPPLAPPRPHPPPPQQPACSRPLHRTPPAPDRRCSTMDTSSHRFCSSHG